MDQTGGSKNASVAIIGLSALFAIGCGSAMSKSDGAAGTTGGAAGGTGGGAGAAGHAGSGGAAGSAGSGAAGTGGSGAAGTSGVGGAGTAGGGGAAAAGTGGAGTTGGAGRGGTGGGAGYGGAAGATAGTGGSATAGTGGSATAGAGGSATAGAGGSATAGAGGTAGGGRGGSAGTVGSAGSGGGGSAGTGGSAPACAPSPPGLQARWRGEMNANDETTVFNGTAMGGLGYAQGRHGSAFLFDGANDVITADPSDALYPPASFSLEVWINTRSSVPVSIVGKYDCGGTVGCSASFWQLGLDAGGHPQFLFRVSSSVTDPVSVTASLRPLNDGVWHHIVAVRDVTAGKAFLYVDGTVAVTVTPTTDLGAIANADGYSDPLTIGASRTALVDTFIGYFTGAIDEIAYYSRAMSATEVAAVYAAPDGICP